jgi:hypothetical protein
MDIRYAFLARSAEATHQGFSVLGGDFDTITVKEFPAPVGPFALVAKLDFPREEFGHHKTSVEIVSPEETDIKSTNPVPLEVGIEASEKATAVTVGLIVNIAGEAAAAGSYRVVMLVDEQEVLSLPLKIVRKSNGEK